ncbi:unnamed protein product [Rhizoctonia solani]|uniref:Uncharacterized protein n=1 Tax=Rhizoctonia solani TaxID=456999 RepID=A0A8H3GBJ7_9AGAM|nr:unnamed protein product [Rhizoctonia solani]
MSLPSASEPGSAPDVTVPWLLSPKWSPSESAWSKKQSTKPPREALEEMFNSYLFLQTEFDYPSLRFEDGKPVMNESYAETQHHMMKLQELLSESQALVVSEADNASKTKLVGEIQRAIVRVNEWIEQERLKAQRFEENFQSLLAEEERLRAGKSQSLECVIA